MNIWINMGNWPQSISQNLGKCFPILYFWFKDHYYQQSPENFNKTTWNWHDDFGKTFYEDDKISFKIASSPPDIFTVSLYIWNEEFLLENAKWIKEHYPKCMVVAGGPSAIASEEFFYRHPYVDIVIIGPGQEVYRQLVDCALDNHVYNTPGIVYKDKDTNKIVFNKPLDRKKTNLLLNYVNNFKQEVVDILDDWKRKNIKILWSSILIQGCPYTCSFCEQGTDLWGKVQKRDLQWVLDEIDLLTNYSDVQIRFFDSNVGIHHEYENIWDYLIEKKNQLNWKVELVNIDYAKNNVNRVMRLSKKAHDNQLCDLTGMIALQDTDLEVLKINGRPGDKDFVKIEAYEKLMKETVDRPNPRVDIILGMPGQSLSSLTNTLLTLVTKEIIEVDPPNLYYVLPNTRLTDDANFSHIKSRIIKRRNMTRGNWIDKFDVPFENYKGLETIVETESLTTRELISMWYVYPVFGYMIYTQYLDTPKNYLYNFYNIDFKSFYTRLIEQFYPENHWQLPTNILKDLDALEELMLGKTEYLEIIDKDNYGHVSFDKLSKYRFIADQSEWLSVLEKVLYSFAPNDKNIDSIVCWMKYKTLSLDTTFPRKILSINWDDVAVKKHTKFYENMWNFNFGVSGVFDLVYKIVNNQDIQFIPYYEFSAVENSFSITLEEIDHKSYDANYAHHGICNN